MVHPVIASVTSRIIERSRSRRDAYLPLISAAASGKPRRQALGCANQAHGFAGCGAADKSVLSAGGGPSLAIVTAYNDMLSAHQPYERFPELIRAAAREAGGVAHGGGRRAGDVRRGHAGRGGDGTFAVFARCHRPVDRRRALACQTFDAAPCFWASATRSCRAW